MGYNIQALSGGIVHDTDAQTFSDDPLTRAAAIAGTRDKFLDLQVGF